MSFHFEKLVVYQKSVDFSDSVCQSTERFERGYGFLVDQLNRAALSIAANIAEVMVDLLRQIERTFSSLHAVRCRSVCPYLS